MLTTARKGTKDNYSEMPKHRIPHTLVDKFYKPSDVLDRRPYRCDKCGERFHSYKELHGHKADKHAY